MISKKENVYFCILKLELILGSVCMISILNFIKLFLSNCYLSLIAKISDMDSISLYYLILLEVNIYKYFILSYNVYYNVNYLILLDDIVFLIEF